ncbi:hypothetical protein CMO93_03390 [Candidatus Woesearchaeota archaeon]|nr:hypothetical protein [Candidatus Woesearchaeota archaeon]|tara:strand:+ start:4273 stop:6057 length:1785 start_codon:yes stop_codon:yes gene_type:complete
MIKKIFLVGLLFIFIINIVFSDFHINYDETGWDGYKNAVGPNGIIPESYTGHVGTPKGFFNTASGQSISANSLEVKNGEPWNGFGIKPENGYLTIFIESMGDSPTKRVKYTVLGDGTVDMQDGVITKGRVKVTGTPEEPIKVGKEKLYIEGEAEIKVDGSHIIFDGVLSEPHQFKFETTLVGDVRIDSGGPVFSESQEVIVRDGAVIAKVYNGRYMEDVSIPIKSSNPNGERLSVSTSGDFTTITGAVSTSLSIGGLSFKNQPESSRFSYSISDEGGLPFMSINSGSDVDVDTGNFNGFIRRDFEIGSPNTINLGPNSRLFEGTIGIEDGRAYYPGTMSGGSNKNFNYNGLPIRNGNLDSKVFLVGTQEEAAGVENYLGVYEGFDGGVRIDANLNQPVKFQIPETVEGKLKSGSYPVTVTFESETQATIDLTVKEVNINLESGKGTETANFGKVPFILEKDEKESLVYIPSEDAMNGENREFIIKFPGQVLKISPTEGGFMSGFTEDRINKDPRAIVRPEVPTPTMTPEKDDPRATIRSEPDRVSKEPTSSDLSACELGGNPIECLKAVKGKMPNYERTRLCTFHRDKYPNLCK